MGNWIFKKAIIDGEKYEINGYDTWELDWVNTHDSISVKDPIYNRHYMFTVYRLKDTNVTFAAGEFSNCVWGIYEYDKV